MNPARSSAASRFASRKSHPRAISSADAVAVAASSPRLSARLNAFANAPIVGTDTCPPMFILRVVVSAAAHLAHDPPPGRERLRITSASSPHRSHAAVPPPHTMHSYASLPRVPRLTCELFSPHHEHHATRLVAAANASLVVHVSTHPAHFAHLPSPIFANPSAHRSHLCVALAHRAQ
jgi:hypothetical protein